MRPHQLTLLVVGFVHAANDESLLAGYYWLEFGLG